MESQFQQDRDFKQSQREENSPDEYKEGRQPQGREGDPNQRLVKRKELDNDEKELDRRPADVKEDNGSAQGHDTSSAISGVQDDQQNSTRNSGRPLGEDPSHNAEIESKEDEE